jgi:hypothetical protein
VGGIMAFLTMYDMAFKLFLMIVSGQPSSKAVTSTKEKKNEY